MMGSIKHLWVGKEISAGNSINTTVSIVAYALLSQVSLNKINYIGHRWENI